MGFFKNLFSKFPCELCGKEVGALGRTKLSDEKYICSDCMKNCSAFYPAVNHTLEEVKEHMEYMKKFDQFCKEVFDKEENKVDFALMFQGNGVIIARDLGLFEVKTSLTKQKNYRELFRFDQIWDYKLYGKENTGENVQKKYKETGVKIKMISKRDNDVFLNTTNAYDDYKHDYALVEFEIPCAHSTDVLDGGMLLKELDKIFIGLGGQGAGGRTEYRKLPEVDMYFNRQHWKQVTDDVLANYFDK